MRATDFLGALMRIQMEFVEMPELKLTLVQAARLWTLPTEVCRAAVAALVATGFLVQTPEGTYRRGTSSPVNVDVIDPLTWAVKPGPDAGVRF